MNPTFSMIYADYKYRKDLEHRISVARANLEDAKHKIIHGKPKLELAYKYISSRDALYRLEVTKVLGGYSDKT